MKIITLITVILLAILYNFYTEKIDEDRINQIKKQISNNSFLSKKKDSYIKEGTVVNTGLKSSNKTKEKKIKKWMTIQEAYDKEPNVAYVKPYGEIYKNFGYLKLCYETKDRQKISSSNELYPKNFSPTNMCFNETTQKINNELFLTYKTTQDLKIETNVTYPLGYKIYIIDSKQYIEYCGNNRWSDNCNDPKKSTIEISTGTRDDFPKEKNKEAIFLSPKTLKLKNNSFKYTNFHVWQYTPEKDIPGIVNDLSDLIVKNNSIDIYNMEKIKKYYDSTLHKTIVYKPIHKGRNLIKCYRTLKSNEIITNEGRILKSAYNINYKKCSEIKTNKDGYQIVKAEELHKLLNPKFHPSLKKIATIINGKEIILEDCKKYWSNDCSQKNATINLFPYKFTPPKNINKKATNLILDSSKKGETWEQNKHFKILKTTKEGLKTIKEIKNFKNIKNIKTNKIIKNGEILYKVKNTKLNLWGTNPKKSPYFIYNPITGKKIEILKKNVKNIAKITKKGIIITKAKDNLTYEEAIKYCKSLNAKLVSIKNTDSMISSGLKSLKEKTWAKEEIDKDTAISWLNGYLYKENKNKKLSVYCIY